MVYISRARMAVRMILPLFLASYCLKALWDKLGADALGDIPAHIAQLPPGALLASAGFSALSFWAVGRYDLSAHRHLGTGVPARSAKRAGRVSIALSQTLGFGLITGALSRWRMLPGISHVDALRLSGFVCATFMAVLGCLSAVAIALSGGPHWPAVLTLFGLTCYLIFSLRFPTLRWRGLSLALPSLRNLSSVGLWAMLDISAAALALYVLMPPETGSFITFLPAFLLALGAGLLASSPGGVGPFELALLTALPTLPLPETLAALAGFRLIYYALPALLAMIAMLRPCKTPPVLVQGASTRDAPRAEIGILAQSPGNAQSYAGGAAAFVETAQCVFAFCDPIRGPVAPMLDALGRRAENTSRFPALYKASARSALQARRQGWRVVHFADEAVLVPSRFDLSTPPRRRLRRKIRQAEKSGVTAARPPKLPLAAMAEIDAAWQAAHGPARGGTMGRFTPDYVSNQICFVAHLDARPIAFVSFHRTSAEWCLDIMRHDPDAPDGTMHLLITSALEAARKDGVPRLSLAAVPACPDPTRASMRALARHVSARSGGPGLRQFKSAFAPRWEPLYAAAPSQVSLVISLLDIARSVQYPVPLCKTGKPQEDDEDYEIASSRAA